MNSVAGILLLRLRQLYRSSGEVGIFRMLFLTVFLLPLIFLFLAQKISVHPWPLVVPAAIVYIIWLIHNRRKDYRFLLLAMGYPHKLFFTEYLLFTLPVTLLLLSKSFYLQALAFIFLIAVISFTIPAQGAKASFTPTLRIIPSGMFEWQSGIRKNLGAIVLFYIPGLAGFYHPGFSAASGLLLTLVYISFYSEYEPRSMLFPDNDEPGHFLIKKVALHVKCFGLFLLPILLVALIHNGFRLIAIGYFFAALNLLTFSILLKYHQYRPGAYSGAHQFLVTLAGIISVILPVALLVTMFNLGLAVAASRNLKKFQHDHN